MSALADGTDVRDTRLDEPGAACRTSRARDRVPRFQRRCHEERGASLIEAAFITPVFLVLLFGIVEFGLAFSDYLTLSNAVRAGARTASSSGSTSNADFTILKTVASEGGAIKRSAIQWIVVYKAGGHGELPSSTCQSGTPVAGVCNVYVAADLARPESDFGCQGGRPDRYWCPTTRKTAQKVANGGPPDYIGVWIRVDHQWVTGMFGTAKTLTDGAVVRIEPRRL